MGMIKGRVVEVEVANQKLTLEKYMEDLYVIPIGLIEGVTISNSVVIGIEYLKARGGGRLVVPPTNSEDEVTISVYRNKETHLMEDVFQMRFWRPPHSGESRPYTNDAWKPGDLIKGVPHSGKSPYGYICVQGGVPGVWSEIGTDESLGLLVDHKIEEMFDQVASDIRDTFMSEIERIVGETMSNAPIHLVDIAMSPILDGDSLAEALSKLNHLLKQSADNAFLGDCYLGNAYLSSINTLEIETRAFLGEGYLGNCYLGSL